MPLTSLKRGSKSRHKGGFTLIEMIGVIAVIAILVSVAVPKIFEAINNSKINSTAVSCNSVKTALVDHYSRYGSFLIDGSSGTPVNLSFPVLQFDMVLLREALIDRPFNSKIGDGIHDDTHTRVEVVNAGAVGFSVATVDPTDATGFALSGNTTNEVFGSALVMAVISGVQANDAKLLNDLIDGPSLGAALSSADLLGRVKYDAPLAGVTTVYVYLNHR
jgi:prepilin-type N-terminal cleavage/methylation domain-containing protein